MKYYLIVGEASGDLHASNLMEAIKQNDPKAEFMFFGGDLMQAQGGTLVKHYRQLAFMGFLPVLLNLRTIQKNFKLCEKTLLRFKPDVLIMVDYPGFNLRMAKFAHEHNIRTAYYISPKVWAWKTKRVHKIKAYINNMYTIFPFETEFYAKYNYKVEYVGNPLFDSIGKEQENFQNETDFKALHQLGEKPIIALLPGSRRHEISSLLPLMTEMAEEFPSHQFVIAGSPGIEPAFYQQVCSTEIPIVFDETYNLVQLATAAIVASGTATLETALLKTPQVVIYDMGFGWLIERFRGRFFKIEFFSLVNLVAEKEVVKELFHSEVTNENIKNELNEILNNAEYRLNMLKAYDRIEQTLKTEGASAKAGRLIVESLKIK